VSAVLAGEESSRAFRSQGNRTFLRSNRRACPSCAILRLILSLSTAAAPLASTVHRFRYATHRKNGG
jgi:hypothetical protein